MGQFAPDMTLTLTPSAPLPLLARGAAKAVDDQ